MNNQFDKLRQQAEIVLATHKTPAMPDKLKDDLSTLIQELDTYRIELELQNAELVQSNLKLQQTQDSLKTEAALHHRHYDIAPVGYVTIDSKNRIIELNQTLAGLLQRHKSQLIQKLLSDFIKDQDQDVFYFFQRRLIESQQRQSCKLRLRTAHGQFIWTKLDGNIENSENALNLHIAISDISSLKIMQDDLRLAAQVFEKCPSAIMVVNCRNEIVKINAAFTRITGYTEQEAVGENPRLLKSGKHPASFYQQIWKEIKQKHYWEGEIWNRRKNGEVYPEWLAITPVANIHNQNNYYIAIFSDITQRKEKEANIHFMAFYDPLTRLANRSLLQERIKLALRQCKRNDSYGALLMLDLDHFKIINDSLGHLVGDQLLQVIAERLQHCIREEDTIARMGGDEFVVLLADLSEDKEHTVLQADTVASKILFLLAQDIIVSEYTLQITTSIGIVIFPSDADEITSLIKLADNAMYKAKKKGRNNFQFFTASMQKEADERLSIQNDLIKGLTNREFELYYQPQIDIASHTVISAEALIRWHHPDKGLVSPAKFIPVAEETVFIIPLGKWVLEQACQQMAVWNKSTEKNKIQHIAVNVSSQQFQQKDFITELEEILAKSAIESIQLELELTETILVQEVGLTLKKLQALKSMGVRIAIDDFGTGYFSLTYLKQFPIDVLKIDQSFTQDITSDRSDAAIVQTIIALGKNLHLSVLAEGVETEQQLDFLKKNGCNAFQGYYYSQPVPAEIFTEHIKD